MKLHSWHSQLPLPLRHLRDMDRLAASLTNHERSLRFHSGQTEYSLHPMRALVGALGEDVLQGPFVHVAGSKGKGSVCLLTESLLRAHGLRTGLTLSPHLEQWNERLQLEGRPAAPAVFLKLVEAVLHAGGKTMEAAPSLFETLIAAAFLGFRQHRVEAAVVEVGIGGRLDATNLIPRSIPVITAIECEHAAVLGYNLSDIAREKAGIIKPGGPVISGVAASSQAARVIARRAREVGVPVWQRGRNLRYRTRGEWVEIRVADHRPLRVRQPAGGPHASLNLALAVSALVAWQGQHPDFELSSEALNQGSVNARFPGRCELVAEGPSLYRDGAHTPRSLRALVRWLHQRHHRAPAVVLGLQQDKPVGACLRALQHRIGPLVATSVPGGRSRSPRELVESAHALEIEAYCEPDLRGAIDRARRLVGSQGVVLVTGSFWLAGEVTPALLANT